VFLGNLRMSRKMAVEMIAEERQREQYSPIMKAWR